MKPVASTAGGEAFAEPDVCKTPPPLPYPNIGSLALAQRTAATVFIEVMPVIILTSYIPQSSGDEVGVLKGVVSGKIEGKVRFTEGSSTVFAAGQPVVYLGCATTQNGDPPNAVGTVTAVSQTIVFTAP
jgi:Domain of unknown function (DUF4150)